MTPLFSDDISFNSQPASTQDALAWLDDIAELQMSFEAGAASGSALFSEYGTSTNATHTRSSSAVSLMSGEDGIGSASSPSSANESQNAKRSKIALDSSQPLTAKGKPRTRVYVACRECRSRKVRCDGAKPACYNCQRRHPGVQACDYDAAPKRRGHDKVPGSRTRFVGEEGALRSSQRQQGAPVGGADSQSQQQTANLASTQSRWRHVIPPPMNFEDILHSFDPASFDPTAPAAYRLPSPPVTESVDEDEHGQADELVSEPSMQFARETWWDALITWYASSDSGHDLWNVVLSAEQRHVTTQHIFRDLRALFHSSIYWASFVHLPRFFETLLDPARRTSIQPGLLLSMLAIGAHVQSSDLRQGERGRKRASRLLDKAHAALQASLSSNWVDIGLVQAAWFICYYELQGQPGHEYDRTRSAMLLLDSLIRLLSLNSLDAGLPDSRFSVFATSAQSMVDPSQPSFYDGVHGAGGHARLAGHISTAPAQLGCECAKYTLKQQWPNVSNIAPLWEATTMWPDDMAEGEIRKEEGRRVVWSSVMLVAAHAGYISADAQLEQADLYIKDYRNYALLFPGEVLCRSGAVPVSQNNVWNLSLRAMVLWHTSVRHRSNPSISFEERTQYAMNAWLEADAIENALKNHTCNLEGGTLHQAQEYLFTTRMCISHEFRRFAPEVTTAGIMSHYRQKAESWLRTQMWVSDEMWESMQKNSEDELSRRPLLVYWFMGHVIRALILFKSDPSLHLALEAGKVFARPLEYLSRIWPCRDQRQRWQELRYKLVEACLRAGVPPPPPTLPPSLDGVRNIMT